MKIINFANVENVVVNSNIIMNKPAILKGKNVMKNSTGLNCKLYE